MAQPWVQPDNEPDPTVPLHQNQAMAQSWAQPDNEPGPTVPLHQNQAMDEAYPPQPGLLPNNAAIPLGGFVGNAAANFGWEGNVFGTAGPGGLLQIGGLASPFGAGPAIGGMHLAAEGAVGFQETAVQKLERCKNTLHTAQSETVVLTLRG